MVTAFKRLVEDKSAHYIAVLKGNHPTLHTLVKTNRLVTVDAFE
ncbi:hypothetical protein [Streptomyces sp. 900105755]